MTEKQIKLVEFADGHWEVHVDGQAIYQIDDAAIRWTRRFSSEKAARREAERARIRIEAARLSRSKVREVSL